MNFFKKKKELTQSVELFKIGKNDTIIFSLPGASPSEVGHFMDAWYKAETQGSNKVFLNTSIDIKVVRGGKLGLHSKSRKKK